MPDPDYLSITVAPGRIVLSRPSGRLTVADVERAELLKAYIDRGRRENGDRDAVST